MTVTANASSSSATGRLDVDLVSSGRLPQIPTAMLEGRDRDLLAPLRFLDPAEVPRGFPAGCPRDALAQALGEANAGYGHPRADELAARLAERSTRVVVTGQQPGLYGGPLLALTKMVAAVRWAEHLSELGQPAVAVFWVATEDHDWAEATQAAFLTRQGARSYDLGEDPDPLKPLGLREYGPGLAELEERIAQDLGDLAGEGLRQAARFYRSGNDPGEAFCRFMIELLGERAPLFLDSMLPGVKRLQSPWLRLLVERRAAVDEALGEANAELERRGYPQQVRHQPGTSPLFLVTGGERRRIVWEGESHYSLRGLEGKSFAVDELLGIAEDEPERLSPSALARPAIQDALLCTTLQVMGPSEISYLAQAAAVYPVLGVGPPWTTLRPQAFFLEERHRGYLEELGVTPGELLAASSVDELIASRLGDDVVTPAKEEIEAVLDGLEAPVLAVDATLENPLRKTRDQVGRAFDMLAGKIAAAVGRRNEVWQRRLTQVLEGVLPDGHLQERHLSVAYYLGRYGPAFVDAYWSDFDLDPRRLQALTVRPGGES